MKKIIVKRVIDIKIEHGPHEYYPKDVELEGGEDLEVSDGYHTMDELYEHRIQLFISLCKICAEWIDTEGDFGLKGRAPWRAQLHADGSKYDGWFIMGIGKEKGKQISYHLPMSKWDETDFATDIGRAPEWDGHTSKDVLERLKNL